MDYYLVVKLMILVVKNLLLFTGVDIYDGKEFLLFVNGENIFGGKDLCVDKVGLLLFIGDKDIFGVVLR